MKKVLFVLSLMAILPVFVWGQVNIPASTYSTSYGTSAGINGTYNSFLGYSAGKSSTGPCNSFFGYNCGISNTTGSYNVFMGNLGGINNKTGAYNVAIGANAGFTNISGNNNVFLGGFSGYSNTGGSNVFIGKSAGYSNTGSNNVFIGYYAGYNETGSNKLYIDNSSTTTPLIYGDFSTNLVNINGKLGIGITAANLTGFLSKNATLGVNGSIAALEVVVAEYANWPDFVFDDGYRLNSLAEIETFIKENNHLPDVPSAADVKENGVNLGEMNKILLQKVEEITVYLIELDKSNKELKQRNQELESRITKLEE